ncbi:GNAT family N-acetyltransferase [Sinorhizobium sp. BJ1]|uniref:GNAT family N-acetyltransferase n=1 Tax=Sinorhizobium sp. BJ1 TaxID=2035455 RepID=UPI000BE827C7|nr:GNAT family N-acetyltransferase [Sinorhizobium sp. BJ1]PDT81450.1 GNAT family N-acetyltransferase [Sinorhizobium sp. BJ1]
MNADKSRPVRLGRELADEAARVLRVSFDERLPSLAGLHTPEEDSWFFRNRVFQDCSVWGIFGGDGLVGIVAFRPGWIDQLYVLPAHQGRGLGASLLRVARTGACELSLWTFQRNWGARRFYENHGFVAVEETDGSRNEEREPDVLYRWVAEKREAGSV